MLRIFLLRAFGPLWPTSFRSEAEKKNLIVTGNEFKHFYECLNLTAFKFDLFHSFKNHFFLYKKYMAAN
jgi:hypothetical protein